MMLSRLYSIIVTFWISACIDTKHKQSMHTQKNKKKKTKKKKKKKKQQKTKKKKKKKKKNWKQKAATEFEVTALLTLEPGKQNRKQNGQPYAYSR